MVIRGADAGDKKNVLAFCKDTFSWGDYISDVWDTWLSSGGLFVSEYDGEIVGMYNLSLIKEQVWVEGLRVDPKHRRKGFGKNMLEHAESIAQDKTIRFVIESDNKPSILLVESLGYSLEEKWQLYSTLPSKQDSEAKLSNNISQSKDLIDSHTYVDSWKWLPLDIEELQKLVNQERVVIYDVGGKSLAMGIWNKSKNFPQTFQIGYLNGKTSGIRSILRYLQNLAYSLNCERIQIFVQEKFPITAELVNKRSLFYLMKKDLTCL